MATLVYNVVTTSMKFLALNKYNSQIGAFCHVVLNTGKKTRTKRMTSTVLETSGKRWKWAEIWNDKLQALESEREALSREQAQGHFPSRDKLYCLVKLYMDGRKIWRPWDYSQRPVYGNCWLFWLKRELDWISEAIWIMVAHDYVRIGSNLS